MLLICWHKQGSALYAVAHVVITHGQTVMVAFTANARWTTQMLREVLVDGLQFASQRAAWGFLAERLAGLSLLPICSLRRTYAWWSPEVVGGL